MFFFRRPTAQRIDRFRQTAARDTFSYPEVGATLRSDALKGEIPERYNLDHNRVRLGEGAVTFERASAALCDWKMFEIGWVELLHPGGPVAAGQTVLVLARTCGLYSLSANRVIAMIDDDSGPIRRRGFSYGTLQHHVERGEERFSIEHDLKDDSVWYNILAFSVPQHPFARIAYPLSRAAQRRFAGDSKAAMLRAIF